MCYLASLSALQSTHLKAWFCEFRKFTTFEMHSASIGFWCWIQLWINELSVTRLCCLFSSFRTARGVNNQSQINKRLKFTILIGSATLLRRVIATLLYLYCLITHLTDPYPAIWLWEHIIMDSIFSGLPNLFTEKDKSCAEFPLSEMEEDYVLLQSSFLEWCLIFIFLLASKVNFNSLTFDDKSNLAIFYIFESDSFSVHLTQLSAVIQ